MLRPRLNSVAIPIFFEFLLGMSVAMIGLWLASVTSDAAAGTLGVMQQVQETMVVLFRVLAIGVGVSVTQLLGAERWIAAKNTALSALAAASWIGLLGALWLSLGRGVMLSWLNTPQDMVSLALPYMLVMAPGLWLEGYNLTMASILRAHLRVRESLVVMVIMHLTHLLLAWWLMLGFLGWEGLGLMGFGVAFLLSRLLGLVLHLWLWKHRLDLQLQWPQWLAVKPLLLWPVLKIGVPGASQEMVYRVGFMVSLATTATLGVEALATHSYVLQILKFVLLVSMAIGWASEIMVGRLIGAGELNQADRLVRKGVRNGLIASGSLATLAALASPWLLRVFTKDPVIIQAAQVLLWMSIALELARVFNLIINGTLRATNDGVFAAGSGMLSQVLVLGVGSYWLGRWFGLPGIWLAYIADEGLRAAVLWWRWHTRGWLTHTKRWRTEQRRQGASDSA
jgi:putative MATE family efflux protein